MRCWRERYWTVLLAAEPEASDAIADAEPVSMSGGRSCAAAGTATIEPTSNSRVRSIDSSPQFAATLCGDPGDDQRSMDGLRRTRKRPPFRLYGARQGTGRPR